MFCVVDFVTHVAGMSFRRVNLFVRGQVRFRREPSSTRRTNASSIKSEEKKYLVNVAFDKFRQESYGG